MSDANCCDPTIDQKLFAPANVTLITAGILVDSDHKILLSKRADDAHMGGLWELPGGKVQSNETPEAALVREFEEELGITTCAGCLYPFSFASYPYEAFHLLMPVFICRNFKGIPIGKEQQELQWINPKDIMRYAMPPANDGIKTMIRDIL